MKETGMKMARVYEEVGQLYLQLIEANEQVSQLQSENALLKARFEPTEVEVTDPPSIEDAALDRIRTN